jgi:hypothetical protein
VCTGIAPPRLRDAVLFDDAGKCLLPIRERFDRGANAVGGPDHQRTVAA